MKHENINKYNFNNLFYSKFFQLFTSNHLINQKLIDETSNKIDRNLTIYYVSIFFNYIVNKLEAEISTIILTMIYLKRIISEQNLFLSLNTILYVFYMILILAQKYNEDSIYTCRAMARIINVPISSFHKMEILLCHLLDHKLFVHEEEYKNDESFIIENIFNY